MRTRLSGRMRRLAVAAGVVAVFAMGAAAYAAIPNADGNIYACYSNGDGSVRVQSDPAKPCAKNWSPLKWAATQADVPVTTTYIKTAVFQALTNSVGGEQPKCNEGDVVTGGGFSVSNSDGVRVRNNHPAIEDNVPVYWNVVVFNDNDNTAVTGTAWAVCQHTE